MYLPAASVRFGHRRTSPNSAAVPVAAPTANTATKPLAMVLDSLFQSSFPVLNQMASATTARNDSPRTYCRMIQCTSMPIIESKRSHPAG